MIIDYDHNPNISYDQKLQSLKESVQMALNDVETRMQSISALLDEEIKVLSDKVDMTDPMLNLDTTASSGVDHDIYASLTSLLNWTDVIV